MIKPRKAARSGGRETGGLCGGRTCARGGAAALQPAPPGPGSLLTRASLDRYLRPERSKSMPSSASLAATSSLSGGTSAPGASTARRATERRGAAACCSARPAAEVDVQGREGAAGRAATAARMAAAREGGLAAVGGGKDGSGPPAASVLTSNL